MRYTHLFILLASLFLFVAATPDFTVFEDDVVINPDAIGGLHIDGAFTIDIIPSETLKIEIINTQDNDVKVKYAYYQGITYIRMLTLRKLFSFVQKDTRNNHVIKIHTPSITELNIQGSNDITVGDYSQEFKLDNLIMDISGSNTIMFSEIDAQRTNTKLSGSNEMRANVIRSPNFKVQLSGSSTVYVTQVDSRNAEILCRGFVTFDVDTLEAESVVLSSAGSGALNIGTFLSTLLDVTTSGNANVRIADGSVENVDFDSSGSSEIILPRVRIDNAEVISKGASKVRVYVTDDLYVDARGASTVSYTGNPKIKSSISGSAKLLSNN